MDNKKNHLFFVKNEYIDNEETDVELEENVEDESIEINNEDKPYNPEKIRVDTHQFSLRNILDMIEDGEIDLAPDFQRYQVWTEKQKCRLIESVLLRIPLPAFYLSSDKKGLMQVVDGVQRLTTIFDYVRSEKSFPLSDLEYLNEQVGQKTFKKLGREWVSRINKTQITVNIIDPQTPYKVKFDIFKRLNTGGTPLVAQEIRHCMSTNRSREFLKSISNSEEFLKVMPKNIINHKRMANIEMILRVVTFKLYLQEILGGDSPHYMNKSYRQYESFDTLLNYVTDYIDQNISDENLKKMKGFICRGLDNSYKLFGGYAFRKWPRGYSYLYPINKALFEVWTVLLGGYRWEDIEANKKEIISRFRSACYDNSSDFYDSISRGTSKHKSIALRFQTIDNLIKLKG